MNGSTPDVPKAYILGFVQQVLAVAVAFGLHITKQQQYAVLALSGTTTVGLIWGYNHLAKHRLQNLDALVHARQAQAVQVPLAPRPGPDQTETLGY